MQIIRDSLRPEPINEVHAAEMRRVATLFDVKPVSPDARAKRIGREMTAEREQAEEERERAEYANRQERRRAAALDRS